MRTRFAPVIAVIMLFLVGCSSAPPTSAPTPTSTPAPTATAAPTASAAPTATSAPSASPTQAASPSPTTVPTATAAPSPSPSPSQASLTPVTVQLDFFPGPEYAPLQRGITKGYFAEQGIELTILPSTGSLDTLQAINSNAVQFAFVDSTTYALQRIQKATETQAIYAYFTLRVLRHLVQQAAQQPRRHGRHQVRHGALQRRPVRTAVPAQANGVDPAP